MSKTKNTVSGYKQRKARNGGADRYGSFQAGRQVSADVIAGRTLWHPFSKH